MTYAAGLGGQPAQAVSIVDKDTGSAADLFDLTGAKALAVSVVDGAGVQVTSFGSVASNYTTATLTNVASSATNVTLLAANASRKGVVMFNESTQSCYVKFAATATSSSYTYQVFPSQTLDLAQPTYAGIIDGIWASANGAMRITEYT